MRREQKSRSQTSSRRARSLADYFRAARRQKLVLLAPALILAIATGIALAKLPKLYKSSAVLAMTGKSGQSDLASRLGELREQVTGREVLETFVNNQTLHEPLDDAISQIRAGVALKADTSREPGAFAISCRATDPETAQKIVADLVDRVMAQNAKAPAASDSEVATLGKRAADISAQLHALEQRDPRLLAVRADVAFVAPSQPGRSSQLSLDAIRAQQMTIEGLKDQQYKFQQELADVERRISEQRQIVEQQSKGSALRDNPTYAVLISKRTELQGQRDTLINRQELTDRHPRVLAINDQIAAINRQIDELRKQDSSVASQSPEARELGSLESQRNSLKIDLEVAGRELARRTTNAPIQPAPEAPPRHDVAAPKLTQEYLGLKRSYQEIAKDLQNVEARFQRIDGADVAQLRVIEPANRAEHPVSLNRALLITGAAAVGLALGAICVAFAESRRFNSLQDGVDVEYYTRLPLLASIPGTATLSERRRARWRARARLAFVGGTSVIATFALTKIFIAADLFALITKE